MKTHYKSFVALVFGFLLIGASMPGQKSSAAQARSHTLTITNESSRQIHRLHISSSGTANWGADLLGRNILHPGAPPGNSRSFSISAGEIDVLFIDANGHQCVLRNFQVYNDRSYSLTDEWLAKNCQ